MNKHKELLFEFDDICKELGIPFFFTAGTALGMYRDSDFIEGDFDIDIGVNCSKEKLIKLFNVLIGKGFRAGECNQNQGWELNAHFWKYGIFIDLHFQHLKDEEKFFENLWCINYEGRIFNVPFPIEKYLELNYGIWSVKTNINSRPLEGDRLKKNGGPKETSALDMHKFLHCEERFEG